MYTFFKGVSVLGCWSGIDLIAFKGKCYNAQHSLSIIVRNQLLKYVYSEHLSMSLKYG